MAQAGKPARRFRHEYALWQSGWTRIAGVDEAGRGPLAGPVVAAAVVLPLDWVTSGMPRKLRAVNDSKQLTPEEREELYHELTSRPEVLHASAEVDVAMIDQINILQATHRAMNQALAQLDPAPEHVIVDGLRVKTLNFPQTPVVGGDALSYSIGAASIVAKVRRDRLMVQFHSLYPAYGFHEHKGYCTPAHVEALKQHGPCPIHRLTFAPVRLDQAQLEFE
jgi:ribonuclease HII